MKKTLVLPLVLLLCALLVAAAPAARMKTLDGGFFTIAVPHQPNARAGTDWQLRVLGENSAALVPPSRAYTLAVSLLAPAPGTLEGLAATLAQTHGAREVTRMAGEGQAYEYTGWSEGLPLYAQLFELGDGRAGYVAICGDYENGEAVWMFNSVRFAPLAPSADIAPKVVSADVSADVSASSGDISADVPAIVSPDAVK